MPGLDDNEIQRRAEALARESASAEEHDTGEEADASARVAEVRVLAKEFLAKAAEYGFQPTTTIEYVWYYDEEKTDGVLLSRKTRVYHRKSSQKFACWAFPFDRGEVSDYLVVTPEFGILQLTSCHEKGKSLWEFETPTALDVERIREAMIDALAAWRASGQPQPGTGPLPDEFVVVAEKDPTIRDAVITEISRVPQ